MKPKVLITISLNTVGYKNSKYFTSREEYCLKNEYTHLKIIGQLSDYLLEPATCAWLRIPLMLSLIKDYDLFYLDNDAIISKDCPSISEITKDKNGFFISRGYSGRPNSGVMIAKNDDKILFDALGKYNFIPPYPHRAQYENGHIIWACNNYPWIELGKRYNNTIDSDGFIIHHTGPNKKLRKINYKSTKNYSSIDKLLKVPRLKDFLKVSQEVCNPFINQEFLVSNWEFVNTLRTPIK